LRWSAVSAHVESQPPMSKVRKRVEEESLRT
jgi:hypothetical protein